MKQEEQFLGKGLLVSILMQGYCFTGTCLHFSLGLHPDAMYLTSSSFGSGSVRFASTVGAPAFVLMSGLLDRLCWPLTEAAAGICCPEVLGPVPMSEPACCCPLINPLIVSVALPTWALATS
jgi:hypothetical protein